MYVFPEFYNFKIYDICIAVKITQMRMIYAYNRNVYSKLFNKLDSRYSSSKNINILNLNYLLMFMIRPFDHTIVSTRAPISGFYKYYTVNEIII